MNLLESDVGILDAALAALNRADQKQTSDTIPIFFDQSLDDRLLAGTIISSILVGYCNCLYDWNRPSDISQGSRWSVIK